MRIALPWVGIVVLGSICACSTPAGSDSARTLRTKPASGFIPVEGGRVAYEVHGSGARSPLLVLHGGPGIPHDYLANLALLGDERPVVFYDQLGCGGSDRPDDPTLWTRERFARELSSVRDALGLDDVVLYGHSWGAILAVDYMTGLGGARPSGVRGVVLAGPALSVPRWIEDAGRLIENLPEPHRAALLDGERTGERETDAYKSAAHVFYQHYVCRRDPWPDGLVRAFERMGQQVYETMSGPYEFTIAGPLRTVDVTSRLDELHVPVLYICGEHDEATPESTRAYAAATPSSEVVVIAGAAHVANYDKPDEYMNALRAWLARHDGG